MIPIYVIIFMYAFKKRCKASNRRVGLAIKKFVVTLILNISTFTMSAERTDLMITNNTAGTFTQIKNSSLKVSLATDRSSS